MTVTATVTAAAPQPAAPVASDLRPWVGVVRDGEAAVNSARIDSFYGVGCSPDDVSDVKCIDGLKSVVRATLDLDTGLAAAGAPPQQIADLVASTREALTATNLDAGTAILDCGSGSACELPDTWPAHMVELDRAFDTWETYLVVLD